ncbi:uncharacterized protein J8A68_002357 [[Candida] subhashii]|uniref:Uncharacterized protein n=1 Tax=[Candida] subhashii TaxID=561895 RepID=A0A8J5QPN0_9ASCO|nr:uncharacterized protein J8A68_002357 [[Candida] subhashii]KAG7664103.1 hypothetical protein J8A68_002357 [[Candida] subhashii]
MSIGYCGIAVHIPRDAFYLNTEVLADICMHSDLLHHYKPLIIPQTFMDASGEHGTIEGRGTLKMATEDGDVIRVPNVAHVPEWKDNELNPLHIACFQDDEVYEDDNKVIHRSLGKIAYIDAFGRYRLSLKIIPQECPSTDLNAVYFSTTAREKICRDWTLLHDYKPYAEEQIEGSLVGGTTRIAGTGTLKMTDGNNRIFSFTNVAYIPESKINMINPHQFLLSETDTLSIDAVGISHSRIGRIGVYEGSPRWLLRSTLSVIRPDNHADYGKYKVG